ncbi:MAG: hypothetical protein RIQ75_1561, partial [Pseudomonadota bacterium]
MKSLRLALVLSVANGALSLGGCASKPDVAAAPPV